MDYPYQYSNGQNDPGGYYPYGQPMPPKKTLFQRFVDFLKTDKRAGIFWLGCAGGAAILLQQLFAGIFASVLVSSDTLRGLYVENETVQMLTEIMYTIFCIGLPFFLIYLIFKIKGDRICTLPFGKPKKAGYALLLIPAGMGICFVGNLLSAYIVEIAASFGVSFPSYEQAIEAQGDVPHAAVGLLLTVVHTAVVPALIEEFAFRGVIMQPLRRYGDWFAIISSAVLFGLLHGNMTQVPFAIIAGIALGYVCVETGTMWTNIVLHFMNNFVSVIYSLILSSVDESRSLLVGSLMIYMIILIGICAFVSYAFFNRGLLKLGTGMPGIYGSKVKCYWLAPPLVAAVIIMIISIASDIAFA